MKTATINAVVAVAVSFGWSAFGQPPCPSEHGQPGVGSGGVLPPVVETFPPPFDTQQSAVTLLPDTNQNTALPAAPSARISIAPLSTESGTSAENATPSARVSLAVVNPFPSGDKVEPETDRPTEAESIQPELLGLVGKWSAVSRYGDGQLATVELQLDDRGWATLTVPEKDGKRSTIRRRILLEEEELKLAGPDDEKRSLGRLIEIDERQMVLERSNGQYTFVRI